MTVPVIFTVPGEPVAKARARATMVAGRARMYTPAKTERFEARVALFAQQAMAGKPPIEGAVALTVVALFPVSASWPKKRQAAALEGRELHTKKPDLDNVIKAVKDGMTMNTEKKCLMCEHWKPRENPPMAKHRMARCALGPAWAFLPPNQTCAKHKAVAEDAAAARVAWAKGA